MNAWNLQLGRDLSDAVATVAKLSVGPTASYAGAKQLLNRVYHADLAEQLEAEAAQQKEQGHSADFVEGVLAFVQKREPNFTGK